MHVLGSADSKGFTGDTLGYIDPNRLRRILAFSGRGRRRYMNSDNLLVYSCQEKSIKEPLPNRCAKIVAKTRLFCSPYKKLAGPARSLSRPWLS